MALKKKTIRGQFANATAVLLAASSTLTRYVISALIDNDTGTQQTWNLAFAATATSAGPGVFGKTLAPNDSFLRMFGGNSRLDNVAISGFASNATSVSYEITYLESDTLDA